MSSTAFSNTSVFAWGVAVAADLAYELFSCLAHFGVRRLRFDASAHLIFSPMTYVRVLYPILKME